TDLSAVESLLGGDWRRTPLAVVHPTAMYRYKGWTDAGWRGVIEHLSLQRGLRVVISSGPGEAERRSIEALLGGLTPAAAGRVVNVAGRWSFAELA
ncbi:glycosyltransferase family 9 protein, partial [Salmonella enterica]|uniref:glycosyltransferase family 9 protein n=1 Tax=Salmonella enterica TaxID=28901 RepID=UPI003FA7A9BB